MDRALLSLLARASSPQERITQPWLRPDPTDTELGGQRLAGWLATSCGSRPERAAEILAARGIAIADWLAALSGVQVEPDAEPPPWVTAVGDLLALADIPDPGPAPTLGSVVGDGLPDWVDASQPWRFHRGFAGWWARADDLVARWCAQTGAAATGASVLQPARTDLSLWAVRRMLAVAGPTLMSLAQRAGKPLFDDSEPASAQWLGVWEPAPVLARLLAVSWLQWQRACRELLAHIAADLPSTTVVARISTGVGDQHAGGRSVAVITLTDGRRLFAKPYPDLVTPTVAAVLAGLDGLGEPLGLALPTSQCRDGWTWVAGVSPAPDMSSDDIPGWFTRAGALLRVLQGLGATDCHHENLICTAVGPVLVDLETALGPGVAGADQSTAMVTSPVDGPPNHPSPDIGGLAGPGTRPTPYPVDILAPGPDGPQLVRLRSPLVTGTALPRVAGRAELVGDHADALAAGYLEVQRRLAALTDPATLLGAPAPGASVRFVPRPTQIYARLLAASLAGPALSDGVERELVLERLWLAAADPALITAEQDALRDLDVPRFTVPIARDDVLVGNDGNEIPHRFAASPLAQAAARLRAVGSDAQRLAELRAAVFAADPRPDLPACSGGHPDPMAVLAARAVMAADGSPAWEGLELDPSRARWACRRLGPGLLGSAGVALALALGPQHAQLGVAGLRWCARAVRERPSWTSQDAHTGPAGVLWALAVAAGAGQPELWDDAAGLRGHVIAVARATAAGELPAGPTIDAIAGAVLAVAAMPASSGRDDSLAELAALLRQRPPAPSDLLGLDPGDPARRWIASLPGPAAGRLLAWTRLGEMGLGAGEPADVDPRRWGDAAALADAGDLTQAAWVALEQGPGTAPDALDLAAIAQAAALQAAAEGVPDTKWQQRFAAARQLAQQQRGPAPATHNLSAIHGTAALAILGLELPLNVRILQWGPALPQHPATPDLVGR